MREKDVGEWRKGFWVVPFPTDWNNLGKMLISMTAYNVTSSSTSASLHPLLCCFVTHHFKGRGIWLRVCSERAGVKFLASREISLIQPWRKWRKTYRQKNRSSEKKIKVRPPNFSLSRMGREGLEEGTMALMDGSGVEGLWSEVEVSSAMSGDRLLPPKRVLTTSGLGPPGSTRLTL